MNQKDVFISHAGDDKQKFVHPLANALDALAISYWLDEIDLKWGQRIVEQVGSGLSISKYVLVLLSESFIARSWTRIELESALNQEISSGKLTVLPVMIAPPETVFNCIPLLRDKLYLKWDEGPDCIASRLLEMLERKYEGHWVHYHPVEYTGKVWIKVHKKPRSRVSSCRYEVTWGPWHYRDEVSFGGKPSFTLWHMKGTDILPIPIYFDISPECYVEFGIGEPPDPPAIDINRGWTQS